MNRSCEVMLLAQVRSVRGNSGEICIVIQSQRQADAEAFADCKKLNARDLRQSTKTIQDRIKPDMASWDHTSKELVGEG